MGLFCATWLLGFSTGCYQCFISVQESSRLCTGYIKDGHSVSGLPSHDDIEACFKKLDVFFNDNPNVILAARVGVIQTRFNTVYSVNSACREINRLQNNKTTKLQNLFLEHLAPLARSVSLRWPQGEITGRFQ